MSVSVEEDTTIADISPEFYNLPQEEQAKLLSTTILGKVTDVPQCFQIDNKQRGDYGLYCWVGRAKKGDDPEKDGYCTMAKACSPLSFEDARNRFCLTLGCEPFLYIHPTDEGTAGVLSNRRGGTISFIDKEKCKGVAGALGCSLDSVKQSFTYALDPNNKVPSALSIGALLVFMIIIAKFAITYRKNKSRYGKRIKKFL